MFGGVIMHFHYYLGNTSYNDGHRHRYQGMTSIDNDVLGHVHEMAGITSFEDGHTHNYKSVTGPAIYANGMHYHMYRGETSVADRHIHNYDGNTSFNFNNGWY